MDALKHLQRLIVKAFRQDLCHAENFDDGAIQYHLVDIDITFIIIKITTMIKIRMWAAEVKITSYGVDGKVKIYKKDCKLRKRKGKNHLHQTNR